MGHCLPFVILVCASLALVGFVEAEVSARGINRSLSSAMGQLKEDSAISVLRAAIELSSFDFDQVKKITSTDFVKTHAIFYAVNPGPFESISYGPPPIEGEPTFPGGVLSFVLTEPITANFAKLGLPPPAPGDQQRESGYIRLSVWLKQYSILIEDGKIKAVSISYAALG